MISTDTPANVTPRAAAPHERTPYTFRDPRTVALGALAIYLAASGTALAAAGHGGLSLLHVAGIVAALWTSRPSSRGARVVGDLMPLFVAPILYAEIPFLIQALGGSYHDAVVQGWERAVFGGQPARAFAAALPNRALSELLHAGYLSYYPAIFAPALLLFVRRERRALNETVAALTLTFLVCWVLFALWPVEGPRYLWPVAGGAPTGPFRSLATTLLAAGSSRGAAFPSSHMAVSVAQAMLALRWQRRAAPVLIAIALLVGVGAVYGGFHYGVDMIAGALLGAGVAGSSMLVARRRAGTGAPGAE